ncbi:MAG: hypothetical protein K2X60_03835 [Xanthobacteraceae bacterium]|nr:hypothetical protein [Xanthobacteraceae bacterium]
MALITDSIAECAVGRSGKLGSKKARFVPAFKQKGRLAPAFPQILKGSGLEH